MRVMSFPPFKTLDITRKPDSHFPFSLRLKRSLPSPFRLIVACPLSLSIPHRDQPLLGLRKCRHGAPGSGRRSPAVSPSSFLGGIVNSFGRSPPAVARLTSFLSPSTTLSVPPFQLHPRPSFSARTTSLASPVFSREFSSFVFCG